MATKGPAPVLGGGNGTGVEEGYKRNFATLIQAVVSGNVALLDCRDRQTGKPVRVIVALSQEAERGDVTFVPLAKMFDGNPYEEVDPPRAEGGYHEMP